MADYISTGEVVRGRTLYHGDATSCVSTPEAELLGRERTVNDTRHATARPVVLKMVQNNTGYALSGRDPVVWSTEDDERGCVLTARNSAANEIAAGIVDDVFIDTNVEPANHDAFYIVIKGPVDVELSDDSAVVAGDPMIMSGTSGKVTVAADESAIGICGRFDEDGDAGATVRAIVDFPV